MPTPSHTLTLVPAVAPQELIESQQHRMATCSPRTEVVSHRVTSLVPREMHLTYHMWFRLDGLRRGAPGRPGLLWVCGELLQAVHGGGWGGAPGA